MLKVLDGGLLTTVQDRGRFGYRSYGIPQTGAMDDLAFEIGNILVGNYDNAAVLEFTQLAGSYQFLDERVFCLAGADFNFKLNNNPIETYTTYLAKKGDILSAEYPKEGIRSYLCISGGIDVPMIMNSRSTFLKGEFGGFDGRKIKKGDIIKLFPSIIKNYKKIKFPHWLYIKYDKEIQIVLDKRTFKSSNIDIDKLLNVNYNVSINIDRMGVRLEADIALADKTDILTEPTPLGTVQITSSGNPIILMNDCQTTGGYSILGYVAPTDLRKVAQLKPNDKIKFKAIDKTVAENLLIKRTDFLKKIRSVVEMNYGYNA